MLSIDPRLCTGCRRCEVACAMAHFSAVDHDRVRIRVLAREETGIDAPVFCVSCVEHFCVNGCPESSLTVGPDGTIRVDSSTCTGCEICVVCCPIGAVTMADELPIFCDLCEGRGGPSCVRACPTHALAGGAPPESIPLQSFAKNRRGRNDNVKRALYVEALGRPLREEWQKKNRGHNTNFWTEK